MSEPKYPQELPHKPVFFLLLLGACILVAVTCGTSLYKAAVNNAWSLNFEHYKFGQASVLKPAPAQHPRAVLWLARDALDHDDPIRAVTLISVLAKSGNTEALIILGDAFALQGQFESAVSAWMQAGAFDSLITASVEAKKTNRPEISLIALEAAFSINDEKSAAPLASLLIDQYNDLEMASTLLQDMIQKYPDSANQASWCINMGRVYTKQKQYIEADQWYGKANVINPTIAGYWITRANSMRESGDLTKTLDLYDQTAKLFPDNSSVFYEMAWAYKLAGATTDSVQSIEKALQLNSDPNVWYEIRAGTIYGSANRIEDALEAYKKAKLIDPLVGTSYLVSFYRSTLKDNKQAILTLEEAILGFPTATQRIGWMVQLASLYREGESWQKVEETYNSILDLDPNYIEALIGLGWVDYDVRKDFPAAQMNFLRSIEIAPNRGEGYFAMGQLLVKEQRYSEADPWFEQAIERIPNNSGWWIQRGNAARSAEDLEKAIRIYNQALERFPNLAAAYYELAIAYKMKNDKEQSILSIETAIALVTPPSEWYYVRAGQIYEWVGSKEQAVTAYQNAITVNPENSSAQQGLTRLGQ